MELRHSKLRKVGHRFGDIYKHLRLCGTVNKGNVFLLQCHLYTNSTLGLRGLFKTF